MGYAPQHLYRDPTLPLTVARFLTLGAKASRARLQALMQEVGAVRQDLDPKATAHIMNMLAYGLVAMDEIMDKDEVPPTDAIIEGIAQIMDRALTPEGGGNSEAGKAVVRKIAEVARQRFEQSNNPDQE